MGHRLILICMLFLWQQHVTYSQQENPFLEINCDSSQLTDKSVAAFRKIIIDKDVVGLGEATHGTHEFFTIKNELIKLLIIEGGYQVIAFETNFSAYEMNQYINGNSLDLAGLMSNFYLIYHTHEFIQLLHWLRDYNQSVDKDKKVVIYGLDTQHMGNIVPMFTGYIQRVDPLYVGDCATKLQSLQGKLSVSKRNKYLKDLESVSAHVVGSESGYIQLGSQKEFQLALKMLDAMKSAVMQSTASNNHGTKSQSVRDQTMVENIAWIKSFEGDSSKIVLWAHNGHLQKIPFELKREDHFRMGTGLQKIYQSKYYAIGFDFDKGSFNAVNYQQGAKMQPCQVANEKSGSFSSQFKEVILPCYFLDFQLARLTRFNEQLSNAVYMRESGIGFSGEEFTFAKLKISEAFDALIFLKNTSPSLFVDARKIK